MKISNTCTACDTTCTCLGFRFFNKGVREGSSETSRRNKHPPCVVTSVESNATSASAFGTCLSASRLIASNSSFGKFKRAKFAPVGGDGDDARFATVCETRSVRIAGWPRARIAARVDVACVRSPASAASARRDASTTSVGTPHRSGEPNRRDRNSSATTSGLSAARNAVTAASEDASFVSSSSSKGVSQTPLTRSL